MTVETVPVPFETDRGNGKTSLPRWNCVRSLNRVNVEIGLADLGRLAAKRPRHTAMAPGRLAGELGRRVPRWEEGIRSRLEDLLV